MRNSAFSANSARIQSRAPSVCQRAGSEPPSLKPLNLSTLQPFPVSRLANHRARTTSHKSPRTSHPSISTCHQSRVTSHASLLLLTSNSFNAFTYATVCNCSFQTTLSPAPATLTRYPLPNSLRAITYEYRGGGGVWQRVRNLLKTNGRPSELARPERVSAATRPFNSSTLQPLTGVHPS